MTRPQADLTTILGTGMVAGTFMACAIIVTVQNPTLATLAGIGTAGAAFIGMIQRAPLPSPEPPPVQTHAADVVNTKEQTS